jgi:hypothetical protein
MLSTNDLWKDLIFRLDKRFVEEPADANGRADPLTGIAERQVRCLIAEGFIAPPRGGRANADCGAGDWKSTVLFLRIFLFAFRIPALSPQSGAPRIAFGAT